MVSVSIEGIIGAGKSLFLEKLEGEFQKFEEPLKEWQNYHGVDMLELVYNDPEHYTFKFQTLVLLTMARRSRLSSGPGIRVYERSSESSINVFNKMYDELTQRLIKDVYNHLDIPKMDYHIYIRTDPDVATKRIANRNRCGEDKIDIEYQRELHRLHDEWLLGRDNVFVVDGNGDFDFESVTDWLNKKWK